MEQRAVGQDGLTLSVVGLGGIELGPGRLERSFAVADGLRPIAAALGATVAQVSIAWVLDQPGVTAAIAGSRSVRHTLDNAGAARIQLDTFAEAVEELIPLGPGFA